MTEVKVSSYSKEKFDKVLFKFLFAEPFFADIIRSLRKVETRSIPTAGVGFDGSSIVLYYNPEFLATLTTLQIFGLLKHECYHIIFKHISSRKQTPHLVWNIATDLAINSTIPMNELPDGGLIPGEAFKETEATASLPDEFKEKRKQLSDFIAALPRNKTSEWYMEQLRQNNDIIDAINELMSPSPSEMAGEGCEEGGGAGCQGKGGIGFDHHFDDDLSEGDEDYVNAKINEILEEAVKRAEENRGWGTCSNSTREKLKSAIIKTVDWKTVLRYFCGTKQRANKSRTFKKINRKYPYQHPGRKIGRTSNIAVYIDQSGSVSNAELMLFFSTLNDLAKRTTFTIFHFDSTVDDKSKYIWKRNKKISKPYRTRSGGTSFESVELFHRKIKADYDGYIIFTDGEAPKPPICKTKRCWVLCPGRKLAFTPDKHDSVVEMSLK